METWSEEVGHDMVMQWHYQHAWPDIKPAMERLMREFDLRVAPHFDMRV